jgi:hypothetical protein
MEITHRFVEEIKDPEGPADRREILIDGVKVGEEIFVWRRGYSEPSYRHRGKCLCGFEGENIDWPHCSIKAKGES